MNIVESLEAKHVAELTKDKVIPDFRPGDTLKVNVRIKKANARGFRPMKVFVFHVQEKVQIKTLL